MPSLKTKTAIARRLAHQRWDRIETDLAARGFALLPGVVSVAEAERLNAIFEDDRHFRKRIDMRSHGYGEGRYAYFAYPLPKLIAALRSEFYRRLAPIANRLVASLGDPVRYPTSLEVFHRQCATAGQTRPTPLLLRYEGGGYNRLHRDLYGELSFPLQVTVNLSHAEVDYEGGEFLLIENLPRRQARGEAVALEFCQGIVFPVCARPVPGKRGVIRAQMRHGVSTIRRGQRTTLGLIFHDSA